MASGKADVPGLESGMSSVLLSSPVGMRRTFSYDDHLNAPMNSPPLDMSVNHMWTWKNPVKPHHRFTLPSTQEESGTGKLTVETKPAANSQPPVVKAKATSLMNTLMIKLTVDCADHIRRSPSPVNAREHTHESLQKFEHQARLTEASYSPHKGLSAEEVDFHRLPDGTPRLRMPSGDFKEDRLATSAQSTPCGTPSVTPCATPTASPRASPSVTRRSWFNLSPGSAPFLAVPEESSSATHPHQHHPPTPIDMGGNEGGGGSERWSLFGTTRSVVQKSPTDPGCDSSTGFSLHSYFGLQKSSTMEAIKPQVHLKVEDPASFMPPKLGNMMEAQPQPPAPRPHKLKPRDLNVLTPSGF